MRNTQLSVGALATAVDRGGVAGVQFASPPLFRRTRMAGPAWAVSHVPATASLLN